MRCRVLTMLMASLLAAACSSSPTSPAPAPGPGPGPDPVPIPSPAPQTETRYDIDVTVRYIDISSGQACDGRVGNTVFGGEFQYRIEVIGPTRTEVLETDKYNEVLGDDVDRGAGERINFTNRTWSFDDLRENNVVMVRFRGTEWDGTFRDPDLNDRTNAMVWGASPFLNSGTGFFLSIGTRDCGMTLVYDLAVVRRQVPI